MSSLRVAPLVSSARDAAEYAGMLASLGRDLPAFLRTPLTLDAARRQLRLELASRERRFLDLVDRAVRWNGGAPTPALIHLKLRHQIEAWLHPLSLLPAFVRAGHLYIAMLARLAGRRLPPLATPAGKVLPISLHRPASGVRRA